MLHRGKNGRKKSVGCKSDQGSVILATSGEPTRYYALSDEGCAGDDNLVLSNVYDCLTFLEADGSISEGLAHSWELSEDGNAIPSISAKESNFTMDMILRRKM